MEVQLELPFTLDDCGGMDKVYVDQGPYNYRYGCYSFGCFYTPFGIRNMDSEFGKRIRELNPEDVEKAEELKFEILRNGHLHGVIKRNLIHNIEIRMEQKHEI